MLNCVDLFLLVQEKVNLTLSIPFISILSQQTFLLCLPKVTDASFHMSVVAITTLNLRQVYLDFSFYFLKQLFLSNFESLQYLVS